MYWIRFGGVCRQKDSILKSGGFRFTAKNVHYKILKTTETDAYDPVPEPKKDSGSKS